MKCLDAIHYVMKANFSDGKVINHYEIWNMVYYSFNGKLETVKRTLSAMTENPKINARYPWIKRHGDGKYSYVKEKNPLAIEFAKINAERPVSRSSLKKYSVEELVNELERRGWKTTLNRTLNG